MNEQENGLSRRRLLQKAAFGGSAVMLGGTLAGCGGFLGDDDTGTGNRATDADVLNFALNLEYLEAEYYLIGTQGRRLNNSDIGTGADAVTGGNQVTFATQRIKDYADEITADEEAHVKFLRAALGGAAVPRPAINLRESFNALAQAAGLGSTFDPFANEVNFMIGAFIFEDVGVTAYKGAAPLISNKTFLEAAAGILAVEAYHAGNVRNLLLELGQQSVTQAVSDLRDNLDGAGDKDQGIELGGRANIVPTDPNGIAFSRSTREVLNIVYGQVNAAQGLFFPNGLNGTIRA
jgi:hypothetical protein